MAVYRLVCQCFWILTCPGIGQDSGLAMGIGQILVLNEEILVEEAIVRETVRVDIDCRNVTELGNAKISMGLILRKSWAKLKRETGGSYSESK
ncbi:uncharacterized protein F5Z01DRAFT_154886 [Emericellopsis atlantica]|uniref:Uncharacterized protein n=1 Tax=Emericellopsis atlantica TaxID=2614577 RepID=A0A9P7ZK58_9HYPO|nr:uncharacterized protein F5Z01DRAFT_154886 [Emericellopsis atlantica]KAG9253172.1 hypothetical protein F5Z01DRAFT_154886 [Emericellopsis atlantica]